MLYYLNLVVKYSSIPLPTQTILHTLLKINYRIGGLHSRVPYKPTISIHNPAIGRDENYCIYVIGLLPYALRRHSKSVPAYKVLLND